jgi:type VI secretion system secreted protein Hcp
VAAVDYFLKVDGIPGESRDAKHKGEIELESFSWGETSSVSQPTGAGGGAGKVEFQPLTVGMRLNKASPLLFLACAEGQHIKEAVLTVRRGGKAKQEFLVYTLEDVVVSSYQTGGTSGAVPVDSVSLVFARITIEYRPQKPSGQLDTPVKAGWDIQQNKQL